MLSDILPTAFECGVMNGRVKPGDTVAIVGAGPIGMSVILTARFYSPAEIIVIDTDNSRLEIAKALGATSVINNSDRQALLKIMALTQGRGVDVAVEAVGATATFDLCQRAVTAGGHIANIGVHGKPVQLDLDRLWSHNVTLTTGLVDTKAIPMLLRTVLSGKIDPRKLITHHFALADAMKAYDTFGDAMQQRAMKVVITNCRRRPLERLSWALAAAARITPSLPRGEESSRVSPSCKKIDARVDWAPARPSRLQT